MDHLDSEERGRFSPAQIIRHVQVDLSGRSSHC